MSRQYREREPLLTPEQLAERLGEVSGRTLETWRRRKVGPPWVRLANGAVRYRPEDVDAWLDSQTQGVA